MKKRDTFQEIMGGFEDLKKERETGTETLQRSEVILPEDKLYALFERYDIKSPSCFSDVGDGWLGIIETLIIRLIDLGWNKELVQVKEKWGELRFYIGEGTGEQFDLIRVTEEMSRTTCERCGSPGVIAERPVRWFKCYCDSCATTLAQNPQ